MIYVYLVNVFLYINNVSYPLIIQVLTSCHEASANQSCMLFQSGCGNLRILIHHIERELFDAHANRLGKISTCYREVSSNDEHLWIEDIDDASEIGSQFHCYFLQGFNAEYILFFYSIQNILQGELLVLVLHLV